MVTLVPAGPGDQRGAVVKGEVGGDYCPVRWRGAEPVQPDVLGILHIRAAGRAVKEYVRDWLLAYFFGASVLVLFAGAWVVAINQLVPIVECAGDDYLTPSVARPGEVVEVCRKMRFNFDAHIVVHRALTQTGPDGAERAISFGRMEVTRKAGTLNQCRSLQLPEHIQPGRWWLRTYLHADPTWPLLAQDGEFGQPFEVLILSEGQGDHTL